MAWDLRQSKTVESHPHPCAADRKIHLPLFLFSYLKIFGFPLRDVLCLHWCHLILPLFKHPHTSINILDMWLGKLKPLLRQSSGPRGGAAAVESQHVCSGAAVRARTRHQGAPPRHSLACRGQRRIFHHTAVPSKGLLSVPIWSVLQAPLDLFGGNFGDWVFSPKVLIDSTCILGIWFVLI